MSDEPVTSPKAGAKPGSRFLGSLRDALAAAGRDDMKTEEKRKMEAKAQSVAATRATQIAVTPAAPDVPVASPAPPPLPGIPAKAAIVAATPDSPAVPPVKSSASVVQSAETPVASGLEPDSKPNNEAAQAAGATRRQSAAEAARLARGETDQSPKESQSDMNEPTTPAARATAADTAGAAKAAKPGAANEPPRTQLVRGKAKVARGDFTQDPVVGWLVIVGGPGLGSFRPVFEGNNTIGRSSSQRVPVDFGDDAISSEEQAYIRYDSVDRTFLFVPNLAKTNVVQVNHQKPTGAVALSAMDVITMGKTQLVFVPFCGADFDWSELSNLKE